LKKVNVNYKTSNNIYEKVNLDDNRHDTHLMAIFPGQHGKVVIRMSTFWILLGAKVRCGGDYCSYKTCRAPVKSSTPTNQHLVFLISQMAFLSPNQQCQSTKGRNINLENTLYTRVKHTHA